MQKLCYVIFLLILYWPVFIKIVGYTDRMGPPKYQSWKSRRRRGRFSITSPKSISLSLTFYMKILYTLRIQILFLWWNGFQNPCCRPPNIILMLVFFFLLLHENNNIYYGNCVMHQDARVLVGSKKEPLDIKVAMSNSFGFGGHNSSILFAHYYKTDLNIFALVVLWSKYIIRNTPVVKVCRFCH